MSKNTTTGKTDREIGEEIIDALSKAVGPDTELQYGIGYLFGLCSDDEVNRVCRAVAEAARQALKEQPS